MATINTIHDLFQLLRDNPEWADELRRLILTTELIDLPRKFDEFVNGTFEEFVEETRAHKTAFDDFVEESRTRQDAADRRFNDFVEESRTRQDAADRTFNQFVEETRARQDAADRRFNDFVNVTFNGFVAETRAHNDATDATIKTILDDIGELKGSNAINAALRSPDLIVFVLSEDLLIEKVLTAQDIGAMLRARPGIVPQEARMSFVEADLLIHVKDGEGEDRYIAAEVSYTVGSNDVDRAIRNAEFLRRLTDKESHAVVVGNDINGMASMIIEREGVTWYQLRRRDTRPR